MTHVRKLVWPLTMCLAASIGQTHGSMPMANENPAWVTLVPIPPNGSVYQAESTRVMATLLKKIYSETDFRFDATKQAQRAQYYQSLLRNHLNLRDEATVRQQLAIELLGEGYSEAAIDDLETLRSHSAGQLPANNDKQLGEWLAYLRPGEQQNCMQNYGQKSCIFPIRAGSVYHFTRGAEGAVREFAASLTFRLFAKPAIEVSENGRDERFDNFSGP